MKANYSDSLFESFAIGDIILKNRVVMAPMTRGRAENPGLLPTPSMAEYYQLRAGAGLILTEGVWPNEEAIGYMNVPGIYTQQQVAAWRNVTDAVHQNAGHIFMQIGHCGAVTHPDYLGGRLPLAPSAINPDEMIYTPNGVKPTVIPQEMSKEDIKRTIADYRQAAINAKAAGFDGVELHAGYLYLPAQFLSSATNRRTDEYGGSVENRARFVLEVLEAFLDVMGPFRAGIKLSPGVTSGLITANQDNDMTYSYLLSRLNELKLAYVHGWYFPAEDGSYAAKFADIPGYFRRYYKGTLIVNGGYDAERASKVIDSGMADLVSFGNPFVANPDLVRRFREGLPLAVANPDFFYAGGDVGYIDYPLYEDTVKSGVL